MPLPIWTHFYRCGNHTGNEFEREAVSVSEVKDVQELHIAEKDKGKLRKAYHQTV